MMFFQSSVHVWAELAVAISVSLAKITFTDNKNNVANQGKQHKSEVQEAAPKAAEDDLSEGFQKCV